VRTGHAVILAGGCAALLTVYMGCTSHAAPPANNPGPAPVVVLGDVTREDVPIEIHAIGSGQAYQVVAVRARVTGQIVKVYFKQGADVKEGDPLFLIDPRPYQETVRQVEATLARDQAALQQAQAATGRDRSVAKNARVEAARYLDLFKQGIVSHEQSDQFGTTAQSNDDTVRADEANIAVAQQAIHMDEANLAAAQLQLGYTDIRAPLGGQTGDLHVFEGSMINPSDASPLVTINQIRPLYVTFSVPEANLGDIRKYSAAGKPTVTAAPPQPAEAAETGVLDFIDNMVDSATGMIQLKGLFANTGRKLWPGQFLNVVLHLTVRRGAVVAPSAAVQNGQNGKYVFVVDSNSIAHERQVTTGVTYGASTTVESGLAPGERVVIDGQLNVVSGKRVQPVQRAAAPPAPATP